MVVIRPKDKITSANVMLVARVLHSHFPCRNPWQFLFTLSYKKGPDPILA